MNNTFTTTQLARILNLSKETINSYCRVNGINPLYKTQIEKTCKNAFGNRIFKRAENIYSQEALERLVNIKLRHQSNMLTKKGSYKTSDLTIAKKLNISQEEANIIASNIGVAPLITLEEHGYYVKIYANLDIYKIYAKYNNENKTAR